MSRHQLTIRFADSTDAQMISRFNARLKAGGSSESIAVQTEDLVGEPTGPLPHRSLMIAEDGAEMRACVLLYHNQLYRDGKPRRICWVQMPLSEGLVDHAHNLAIVHLMKAAVKYEPLLISLGVGSLETQWGRFAKSLGWQHSLVPFFFLPLNVGRVLTGLGYLRRWPAVRAAAAVASKLGLGALATAMLNVRRSAARRNYAVEEVSMFESWAAGVFQASLSDYPLVANRNANALNIIYEPRSPRFRRLRVRSSGGGDDIGWVVVNVTPMKNNMYFGDLRVGVIVDGMSSRQMVPVLLAAAVDYLAAEKVDLIVCNWSHPAWIRATRAAGFFKGPSNFLMLVPKEGVPLIPSFETLSLFHVTRGDSDGMVRFQG